MDVESIQKTCLELPHVTEHVQWGDDLVFKVAGKMFAVTALEKPSHGVFLSFKCSPEDFDRLIEIDGIRPAPYLARAKWVGLEHPGALDWGEVRELLRVAYGLIFSKLPKKTQRELSAPE